MISEPLKPLVRLVSQVLMQDEHEVYIECGEWRLEYSKPNWFVYNKNDKSLAAYPYWGTDLNAAIDKFLELINAN